MISRGRILSSCGPRSRKCSNLKTSFVMLSLCVYNLQFISKLWHEITLSAFDKRWERIYALRGNSPSESAICLSLNRQVQLTQIFLRDHHYFFVSIWQKSSENPRWIKSARIGWFVSPNRGTILQKPVHLCRAFREASVNVSGYSVRKKMQKASFKIALKVKKTFRLR